MTKLEEDEARAGETGHGVRFVLLASTVLAALGLFVALAYFVI